MSLVINTPAISSIKFRSVERIGKAFRLLSGRATCRRGSSAVSARRREHGVRN